MNESNITFGLLTSGRIEQSGDKHIATMAVRSADNAGAVLKTWGKDLSNIYFATDVESEDKRFVKMSESNDYRSTGEKQLNLCKYMIEKCEPTDWYVLADDDTYIYIDNLVKYLEYWFENVNTTISGTLGKIELNSNEPIAVGRVLNCCAWDKKLLYHSGGAGIALNRKALELIVEFFSYETEKDKDGNPYPGCGEYPPFYAHTKQNYFGDVAIGYAYKFFGIEPINCDHFQGRTDASLWGCQLSSSIQVKKDFPKLATIPASRIISFHSISADDMINADWDLYAGPKFGVGPTYGQNVTQHFEPKGAAWTRIKQ
ncbi:hypothetical protein CL622_05355 [archaeon]|nr:hypothetical protein [archaeon]|tara:strand:+ start:1288 stop:2232 length:945 start_codon:yes stop_codon:yes gene_type:complete